MTEIEQLTNARDALAPFLHRTPLMVSRALSRMVGRTVYLKAELLQKTGSYKPRGMIWKVLSLTDAQRSAGVTTYSSGNAAQALAYAGAMLGVKVTVVMADTANPTKIQAARDYGADVIQHGSPAEASQYCNVMASERNMTFVSAYDDDTLMAGHASLGLEIIEELPDVAAIYFGIGGGGMAGGLVKAALALDHSVQLIGVEPKGAQAAHLSLKAKQRIQLSSVDTIADGLAARSPGIHCFEMMQRRLDRSLVVEDAAILSAMRTVMQRCKLMPEPAGAACVAGLLQDDVALQTDGPAVCVISGGNVDLGRLKEWL